MPDSLTVIGFDVGTHWIGSAVGQTQTQTASPLQPIRVINQKPDWAHIEKLIKTWEPTHLVVGYPRHMTGEEHAMSQKAKRFSRQLEGRFHIKTHLTDERLTTREAWQIVENEASQRISKPDMDCIAAVLITEDWLHQQ